MKVFNPFANMTKKQKTEFLYEDLISRNLVDEKTAKKELNKTLKKIKKKEKAVAQVAD